MYALYLLMLGINGCLSDCGIAFQSWPLANTPYYPSFILKGIDGSCPLWVTNLELYDKTSRVWYDYNQHYYEVNYGNRYAWDYSVPFYAPLSVRITKSNNLTVTFYNLITEFNNYTTFCTNQHWCSNSPTSSPTFSSTPTPTSMQSINLSEYTTTLLPTPLSTTMVHGSDWQCDETDPNYPDCVRNCYGNSCNSSSNNWYCDNNVESCTFHCNDFESCVNATIWSSAAYTVINCNSENACKSLTVFCGISPSVSDILPSEACVINVFASNSLTDGEIRCDGEVDDCSVIIYHDEGELMTTSLECTENVFRCNVLCFGDSQCRFSPQICNAEECNFPDYSMLNTTMTTNDTKILSPTTISIIRYNITIIAEVESNGNQYGIFGNELSRDIVILICLCVIAVACLILVCRKKQKMQKVSKKIEMANPKPMKIEHLAEGNPYRANSLNNLVVCRKSQQPIIRLSISVDSIEELYGIGIPQQSVTKDTPTPKPSVDEPGDSIAGNSNRDDVRTSSTCVDDNTINVSDYQD